jgi:small subunit ribosomal protein S17
MTPSPTEQPRTGRKTEIGVVASAKMDKTRRIELQRLVPHPKYGKYERHRTVCYAHDETNETHVGDIVEIMETRPLSKTKRWRVVRIVTPSPQRSLEGVVVDESVNPAPEA